MPTELEELVDFIGDPRAQIRQVAVVSLIPYSTSNPEIFKANGLQPIKQLRLLIRDHPTISQHAANILVNLSADPVVLDALVADSLFLDTLLARVVLPSDPGADFLCMLLANLAKAPALAPSLHARKQSPPPELSSGPDVLGQLADVFVKGAGREYNQHADYDHLAYLFADLSAHPSVRAFLVTPQPHDGVIPLAKLKVFTSHPSEVRRAGVASTIKNCAFDIDSHPSFLSDSDDSAAINVLPYVLLPLAGPEEFDEEDAMDMLPDLQLLPPDKKREPLLTVLRTHVETLLLLATTRPGRERMREIKLYPLVREMHAKVQDEQVEDACDRLVQLLMRDEEAGSAEAEDGSKMIEVEVEVEDGEDMLVEV